MTCHWRLGRCHPAFVPMARMVAISIPRIVLRGRAAYHGQTEVSKAQTVNIVKTEQELQQTFIIAIWEYRTLNDGKWKNTRNHQVTDMPAAPIDQEKSWLLFQRRTWLGRATIELPRRHGLLKVGIEPSIKYNVSRQELKLNQSNQGRQHEELAINQPQACHLTNNHIGGNSQKGTPKSTIGWSGSGDKLLWGSVSDLCASSPQNRAATNMVTPNDQQPRGTKTADFLDF